MTLSLPPAGAAHRIGVVGGGAGGVELATKLGDKAGRKATAGVTLVDRSRTHLWKPLLHKVAAGSKNMHEHQLDYLAQARWHRFAFAQVALAGLDRAACEIVVSPVTDDEGQEILSERRIGYDTLVIAIRSESNDFNTPGLPDHVAEGTLKVLTELGVEVLTNEKVVEVTASGLKTASGREPFAALVRSTFACLTSASSESHSALAVSHSMRISTE